MDQERRTEARRRIGAEQAARLSVEIDGQRIAVEAVFDVSPTGVGLRLASPVADGTRVEVCYCADEIDLRLPGTVIWTDADSSGTVVGVHLLCPSLLHTFL